MASEIAAANQFVYGALVAGLAAAGLSAVPVFQGNATEDDAPPYVTFSMVVAPARLGSGARLLHAEPLFLVRAHYRKDSEDLADIDDVAGAIDDGLTGAAAATIDGWRVAGCWRDPRGSVDQEGLEGGVLYVARGAYYRLHVHPSS
jgi:hypothetical protein